MAEYITGDCHGDFQKVEVFCRRMQTTIEDCMIILGDAGINYCMDHRDTERKKYLAGLPITVFLYMVIMRKDLLTFLLTGRRNGKKAPFILSRNIRI